MYTSEFRFFEACPGIGVILLADAPLFTIAAASNDFLAFSGKSRADVVGKSHFEVFPEDPQKPEAVDQHSLSQSFAYILQYKKPHALPLVRYDIPNDDGSFSEKYWKASNAPVLNDAGEVAYIIHTAEDVTSQVTAAQESESHQSLLQAYKKVADSEQKYRSLFESIDQGFCLVELIYDAAGRPVDHLFLETNQVYAAHTGLKDVVGKTAKAVVPDIEAVWFERYQYVVASGRPLRFTEESKALKRWFEVFVYPTGEKGCNRVAVLFADITERKQAEQVLQATKEAAERQKRLYETITANTPDLIYVFDLQYRFTYANEAMLTMWGKTWSEAIGRGLLENGYEPWHADMHHREIDHIVATRQPVRGAVSFPHAVLGKRIYDYILVPVINKQGVVEAVAGTTRDITDIKAAEEALFKSEQQQSFLLRLNDRLRELGDPKAVQYEAAKMIGEHLGAERVGYAEDGGDESTVVITSNYTNGLASIEGRYTYDDYGPELLRSFREGRTVVRNDIARDSSLSGAEKEAHARLGLGATVNVPLLRDGKLAAIFFMHFGKAHQWTTNEVALMEEVAARTWEAVMRSRTEKELRESEARFRLMADAVPLSMWITDANGNVEFLNEHWLDYSGSRETQTTSLAISENFLHPEDGPRVMQVFADAMQTGQPWEVEQRNLSKDGSYRWFLNRAQPYHDPVSGNISKWFGVGIDIHDRKLAEQALRQSEEALERKVQERTLDLEKANHDLKHSNANLEEFAYAASHDMKEPIRKIHFFADHLKSRLDGKLSSEDLRYFGRMEAAAQRMSTLIDDLLTYSHISSGISHQEPVDLNHTFRLVLDDMELVISEKEAQVELSVLPVVEGHRRQLQQLFENLIGNALKYSKPGAAPRIAVHSRLVQGSEVPYALPGEAAGQAFHLITVQDNGIGFEQSDAERIFNVFTRLHGLAEYKGTGVGLSIVRKVVENHSGYVWAKSQPGEGALFYVLLPAQ